MGNHRSPRWAFRNGNDGLVRASRWAGAKLLWTLMQRHAGLALTEELQRQRLELYLALTQAPRPGLTCSQRADSDAVACHRDAPQMPALAMMLLIEPIRIQTQHLRGSTWARKTCRVVKAS